MSKFRKYLEMNETSGNKVAKKVVKILDKF